MLGENRDTLSLMPENVAVLAVGAVILLALAVLAFVAIRRRRSTVLEDPDAGHFDGPEMMLHQDNEPDALALSLVPVQLTIGTDSAKLAYRIEIANRGTAHIVGLRLAADMVSARVSENAEEERHLLMGPDMGRAAVETVSHIDPGTSFSAGHVLNLPLSHIEPIRRDDIPFMLPFVRMRAVGAGTPPRRFSFVVGLAPEEEGGRLMPIRLDQGSQVLRGLSARLVA